MKKYSICVVTGSRAEYGLLKKIITILNDDKLVDLRLVVTGSHLHQRYGHTIDEISNDGFAIDAEIECITGNDDDEGMILSTAKAMEGFAKYFSGNRPDMLVILGDRYEIFACATAAAIHKIPIAHLYGGDTTEGAIDEFLRHSITKMSYLHFVSNEESRNRVIQLGENPDRVYNVGSTGAENIMTMELLKKEDVIEFLGVEKNHPYALVTYHPVTMEQSDVKEHINHLLSAIDDIGEQMSFVFTKANADGKGLIINEMIDSFVDTRNNCKAYESLGMLRYLSAMKYAEMVIGNSSSGIYETPLFGIPTVNIGDRQRGRLQASSILNCGESRTEIVNTILQAIDMPKPLAIDTPYYKEDTAETIVRVIKKVLADNKIDLKKGFYKA